MSNQASATVAANIRAEVARQRLPQVKIAAALDLPQASVSKRLRGMTPFTIDELHAMSRILDVPISVLMSGINDREDRESA